MEIHLATLFTLLMLHLRTLCQHYATSLHGLYKPLDICEGEKLQSLLLFHNTVYTNTLYEFSA